MSEALKDKVKEVRLSDRLKSHPVCLVAEDGVSLEMEKVLNAGPVKNNVKATTVLEINPNHDLFKTLQKIFESAPDQINDYADVLYDQARLIDGLTIEDPVSYTNKITELMIKANQ